MAAAEISARELWPTVGLEAAVFFSFPTWALTVEGAWPGDEPYRFAFTLVAGAFVAMVVCHVAPAFWIRRIPRLGNGRLATVVKWGTVACLCAIAGVSLGQIARVAGLLTKLWYEDFRWHPTAGGTVTVVVAVVSWAVACSGPRVRGSATVVFCALGIGLCAGSLFAQWPGLSARILSLVNGETALNDSQEVFAGMLVAATPVIALAARIGRMPIATRRVWWSGLVGVWSPLVASVALCSLAKMGGARLLWKPSLPIGFTYAFTLSGGLRAIQVSWSLAGLTLLAPCVVWVTWIKDLSAGWNWRWERSIAVAVALAGFIQGARFWDQWWSFGIYRPWSWVLLCGSALLWLACQLLGRYGKEDSALG